MKQKPFILLSLWSFGLLFYAQAQTNSTPFCLKTGQKSRSICFENPTGEPGSGGKAASNLGIGRKGAPCKGIKPHEEVTLCDIKGNGTIRHIWMAGGFAESEFVKGEAFRKLLRSTIVRAWWDGQEHPSIECPLGDFMGLSHSKVTSYQSAIHSVGRNAALNIWLPMPFAKSARITLTNESDTEFGLYYQMDYTLNDRHKKDVGRLHVCFQRQNPTTLTKDFEILPKRTGKGRYLGAVIGVRTLYPGWWGEGEIKIYQDGDTAFPTICGTGSEDYVGLSWGIQDTPFLYHGCNLNFRSDSISKSKDLQTGKPADINREYVSMYRWHLPDPIYWEKECRITIQQIGPGNGLYEREDDWSAATFWYESVPSAPLPKLPSVTERTNDLEEVFGK